MKKITNFPETIKLMCLYLCYTISVRITGIYKLSSVCLLSILFMSIPENGLSQSLAISSDGSTAHASAILDIKSYEKGILVPRTSTASRIAIVSPAIGLMLFDTTTSSFWFHNGSDWSEISAGNNTWSLTGNAGTDTINNFLGTTDANDIVFKVNNVKRMTLTQNGHINLIEDNYNTVIGDSAGVAITTGSANQFIGFRAGSKNTTGNNNHFDGWSAGYSNSTGGFNTAVGPTALYSNKTGNINTAIGFSALFNNNLGAGNVAVGSNTLSNNINGFFNTAIGTYALSNSTGNFNTALGYASLQNHKYTHDNTAIGSYALYADTSGTYNTAVGYATLFTNKNGAFNTAIGHAALYNSTSNYNTAVGHNALVNHKSNDYNTAIGSYALNSDTSGTFNTSVGYGSLFTNKNGAYNTALGQGALYYSTSNYNTAVGYGTFNYLTGGQRNIAIGYGAGTANGSPNVNNTISIGNDDILNAANNQVFIGNLSIGWIGGKVGWSTYSDARIKNTIKEDVKGLDFILRLRPVTYHISNKAISTITCNKEAPDFTGKNDGENIKFSGFLAQEVEQAAIASGFEFSGYDKPKNQQGLYSIKYAEFVVPLVKAVQELAAQSDLQQKMIEAQQNKIMQLQQQNDLILNRVAVLEKKN